MPDNNEPRYSTPAFTEADMWNLDITFARYIAAGLDKMADVTHGYPGTYQNFDAWASPAHRDLRRYAAIFTRYSENGADFPSPIEEADMRAALQWFATNFQSLWT